MRFIDASLSPVATFYTDQISQDLFDGEFISIPAIVAWFTAIT
jgi:hypothetical protein